LIDICGKPNTKIGPIDDQIINLPKRDPVKVRTSRATKLIGVPFSEEQITNIFTRLGMVFERESGVFSVTPPPYRFDIEIEEDLIAEISRIYGFENIPALLPSSVAIMRVAPENQRSLSSIRHQLVSLDYQEMMNFSFVKETWETDFTNNSQLIKLLNPISSQMSVMRSSLIAGLVANVKYNVNRSLNRVRIFEIGTVYIRNQDTKNGPLAVAGFDQLKKITAMSYGMQFDEQWGQENRATDFFDIKSDLESLFSPVVLNFRKIEHPALNPGRSAQVLIEEKPIGFIGELHPFLQKKYGLPLAPVVFEVDSLILQQRQVPTYVKFSKFPSVSRDLSIVVKQSICAQELLDIFIFEQKK
jgi:phenylalanyl-tRNA synthetase beta chain